MGGELKQSIAPSIHLLIQLISKRNGLLQKLSGELALYFARLQRVAKLVVDKVSDGAARLKAIESLVEPCEAYRFSGIRRNGYMNINVTALPNTIQPSYPLLEQVRMVWQVETHEMLTKLEISSLTTYL